MISPQDGTKVRILFLAANIPKDPLALDVEARSIHERLRAAGHRDQVEFFQHGAVRPGDLLELLNEHRPHVVHFSGHGSDNEELYLLDDHGAAKPVSKKAIEGLFAAMKDRIRLVVLNACYSQPQAEAIASHIDCSIGMSRSISDAAAITFAARLYSAIAYGASIKNAFDQAKVALDLLNIPGSERARLLVRSGVDSDLIHLVRPQ